MKPRSYKQIAKKIMPPALILVILGMVSMMLVKQPIHAASNRAKTVAGVLFGGTAGGGVASIAGNAKWFPLGFGVGGLAGGLVARHIRKRKQRRRGYNTSYNAKHTKTYHEALEPSLRSYNNGVRNTYKNRL